MGGLGRPVLSIDRAAVTLMRSCNHNWVYIAEHLGVSTRTLSRWRADPMNPFIDPLKPATRDELVSMVVQYCGPDVSRGEISTMGFIRSQGHRTTRQDLRDVIEEVDPSHWIGNAKNGESLSSCIFCQRASSFVAY